MDASNENWVLSETVAGKHRPGAKNAVTMPVLQSSDHTMRPSNLCDGETKRQSSLPAHANTRVSLQSNAWQSDAAAVENRRKVSFQTEISAVESRSTVQNDIATVENRRKVTIQSDRSSRSRGASVMSSDSVHARAMQHTLETLRPQGSAVASGDSLNSSNTLPSAIDSLTRSRSRSVQPYALIEGFFERFSGKVRRPDMAHHAWPQTLRKSKLEAALVKQGFCPDPKTFHQLSPVGLAGTPFVFSLLETTLDPNSDPNGVLYCFVCSAGGRNPFVTKSVEPSPQGTLDVIPVPNVLCIVTKLPLFDLFFRILETVRSFGHRDHVLKYLNWHGLDMLFADRGVVPEMAGVDWDDLRRCVRLSRPLADEWRILKTGATLFTENILPGAFARWQVHSALHTLLTRWPSLAGDTLARLLVAMLLEQKVLLIGDVDQVSTVALLLRALMWPFRWMHPLLSAPPPVQILDMPLLEATMPIVVSICRLHDQWGCDSVYTLPEDVVVGILSNDYVHVSDGQQNIAGLPASKIRFPGDYHASFTRHAAEVRRALANGGLTPDEAVEAIRDAIGSQVGRLAEIVRRYAAWNLSQLLAQWKASAQAPEEWEESEERCFQRAVDRSNFMEWLSADSPLELRSSEAAAFYETFFQTQLCIQLLAEEVAHQWHRSGANKS